MIDMTEVRIGARRLTFGASDYRNIVSEGDLQGAQDMVAHYRSMSGSRSVRLRCLSLCSAAYWASIVDAITARQS